MSNLFGVEISGGGERKVLKPGKYDAVLYAIVQTGVHKREYKGEQKTPAGMIKFFFEIPGERTADDKSVVIGKEMPALLSEKSNFYKYLKAMGVVNEPTAAEIGKVFSSEESVNALIGLAVSVEVDNFDTTDGKTLHYLAGVSKLDSRLPQPESELEGYVFTFAKPDLKVFKDKMSGYLRDRIMHSLNVKDLPKDIHEYYITDKEERDAKFAEKKDNDVGKAGDII